MADAKPSGSSEMDRSTDNLEHKLWIGNIDKRLSEFNLTQILQRFGEIKSFEFLFHNTGPQKGEPRGYCFVEYTTRKEAEKAIKGLNGKQALSKALMIDWAKEHQTPRTEKNSEPVSEVPQTSRQYFGNTDSKIRAIEAKLKMMESSSNEAPARSVGKHPLLLQSERNKTHHHPYKQKRQRHGERGRTR